MNDPTPPEERDTPPVFGEWKTLYIIVLTLHAVVITLFWFFSKYYE